MNQTEKMKRKKQNEKKLMSWAIKSGNGHKIHEIHPKRWDYGGKDLWKR